MTNYKFKDLKVWQESIKYASYIYSITATFPDSEKYGLTSQIRRSVVSIASNIAEGSGRNSNVEFARFLSIALGSAYELETQLLIANELGFIKQSNLEVCNKLEEIQKMLYSLQRKLEMK